MQRESTRKETTQFLDLTHEQRSFLKEQFKFIDRAHTGHIYVSDLKELLGAVGETVTDQHIAHISGILEDQGLRKIDLNTAMRIWSEFRELKLNEEEDDDDGVLHAFVAMGGNLDKTGCVKKQTLVDIIKVQFGLTIDIEAMLEDADLNIDDDLKYTEFLALFGSGGSQRTSRINSIFSIASSYVY